MAVSYVSKSYKGEKYQAFSFLNCMTLFSEAISGGESFGYLKYMGDIHKVEVIDSEEGWYEISVNEIVVGTAENIGEMWEIVSSAIEGFNYED